MRPELAKYYILTYQLHNVVPVNRNLMNFLSNNPFTVWNSFDRYCHYAYGPLNVRQEIEHLKYLRLT